MARYLLECPHTQEDCLEALDSVVAFSDQLIGRFDWGCMAGEHVGWVTVEAQDERTAKMLVPTNIRGRSRAVLLTKFTPADVMSFHEKA